MRSVHPSPFPSPFPSPTKIRAVLFDVDGTLTDTDPLHCHAYREVLVEVIPKKLFAHSLSGS